MNKAIIYARNTRKKSIGAQVERVQKYCNDNGIEVVGIVRDNRKGKRVNRWKLKKSIRMAKRKDAELIVTYNLSRISRNLLSVITYLNHIEKHNIKLCCTEERLILKNGNGFSKLFANQNNKFNWMDETA